jgi:hypothetical protein
MCLRFDKHGLALLTPFKCGYHVRGIVLPMFDSMLWRVEHMVAVNTVVSYEIMKTTSVIMTAVHPTEFASVSRQNLAHTRE